MTKKYKKIPEFKKEKEEIKFWDTHNFTDYIDWSKAMKNPVFPNLKYSTKTISIRFKENILDEIRNIANRDDIPYQSLIKHIVGEYVRNRNAIPSQLSAMLSTENTGEFTKERKIIKQTILLNKHENNK